MIMLGSAIDNDFGALVKPSRNFGGSTQTAYIIVVDADAHPPRGQLGSGTSAPNGLPESGAGPADMEIVTHRLLMREFAEADLAALIAYQADTRYAEFHGPDETSLMRTGELLRMFRRWAIERPRRNYQLAIESVQEPREVVGNCGIRSEGLGPGMAEFGVELAPRWWGHCYASEATHALLEFGFRELGLEEIRGVSVTANVRVARLVRRLGFVAIVTRPGPDWMRAQGWSQTEWQLTRDRWAAHR